MTLELEVVGVSKTFDGRAPHAAVADVSLGAPRGELLVLLGPSGSGKTTLLKCIAGLLRPSTGRIAIRGTTVFDASRSVDIPTYRRRIAMVFQNFVLWPHMTVYENVAYPLRAQGLKKELRGGRVDDVLKLVRCSELAVRLPGTLSGGQQQRVALARALVANPSLVLFDEPLSNLDALLRVSLRTDLRELHRLTGFTGVYVTHDQAEALSLGTRIAVMNQGRVVQLGTPEDIYRRPSSEYVADFMGMSNVVSVTARDLRLRDGEGQLHGVVPRLDLDQLTLRFRPDDTTISTGAENVPRIPHLAIENARMIDSSFLGREVEFVAQLGTTRLKVRAPAGTPTLTPEGTVNLRIPLPAISAFHNGERVEFGQGHPAAT